MSIPVEFEPAGRSGECRADESLLACAHRLGVRIAAACGGHGRCRSCRVRVISGTFAAEAGEERLFSEEEWLGGWRRACRGSPSTALRIAVPPRAMLGQQRVQTEGEFAAIAIDPAVRTYPVRVPVPRVGDPRSDADRLLDALEAQQGLRRLSVDAGLLKALPLRLREWEGQVQAAVAGEEVVALLPAGAAALGLAIDLGTTKIAAYLIELASGRLLASRGALNPQVLQGDDLITRLDRAMTSAEDARGLQRAAAGELERLAQSLCRETERQAEEIVEVVVAGNTAMHHLLLGLPVEGLAKAPYLPVVSAALTLPCREIGLTLGPGTRLHLLPNIAGFVGGDHAAVLTACGADKAQGTRLYMDIGTNTEVSLLAGGRLTSVSCASGPAFEGGHITDGMRAAPGAIERFWLIDGQRQYQTIDGETPAGVCGSGLLDVLAALRAEGLIEPGGRLSPGHPAVRARGEMPCFVLVPEEERGGPPELVLTQRDIRELQLAKAAIRSGIEVLLREAGCVAADLDEVALAGAFGSYFQIESALAIGLLPPVPRDRIRQVGNAAGVGACQALLSRERRLVAQQLARSARYIELAADAGFQELFTAHLAFPPGDG